MENQSKEYILCDDCKACKDVRGQYDEMYKECRLYPKETDGFPLVNNRHFHNDDNKMEVVQDGCFDGIPREKL